MEAPISSFAEMHGSAEMEEAPREGGSGDQESSHSRGGQVRSEALPGARALTCASWRPASPPPPPPCAAAWPADPSPHDRRPASGEIVSSPVHSLEEGIVKAAPSFREGTA